MDWFLFLGSHGKKESNLFEIIQDKRISEENNNEIFDNKLNQNARFLLFEDNLLLISFGTQIHFCDLNHLTKPSLIGIYKLKQWNLIYNTRNVLCRKTR